METIRQIKLQYNKNDQKFSNSMYWNYCTVFHKLQQNSLIETSFVKAFESDKETICELVNEGFASRFTIHISESKNLEIENYCRKIDKEEKPFDPTAYAQQHNLDIDLVRQMHLIQTNDQLYRGNNNEKQAKLDKKNLEQVEALFKQYNRYIGESLVGPELKSAMWLVIQHSNTECIEKYLPILHKAVKENELPEGAFKMSLDRYYSDQFGYQLFGSQAGVKFAPSEIILEIENLYQLKK